MKLDNKKFLKCSLFKITSVCSIRLLYLKQVMVIELEYIIKNSIHLNTVSE